MKNLLKWILVTFVITIIPIQIADASGWSGPVMISDGNSTGWFYPQVDVDGEYVHVVWRNDWASGTQYRRSTDNGSTWDSIKWLLYSGGGSYSPKVAASGQYVHAVWRGNQIAYARSTDYGATFAVGIDLASDANVYLPDVATHGSMVYVVWFDTATTDINLRRSTNNGASWLAPQNLTAAYTNQNDRIRVAAYNNNVYIVWAQKDTENAEDVMFMRSTDSGVNWSTPVTLWNDTGSPREVSIAAYGPSVYVLRDDSTNGPLQRKSIDSGASFGVSTSIGHGDDQQPEVDATSAYTVKGCNVYLHSSDDGIYVSTGPGTKQKIGTITSTTTCKADIAANDKGDMHVVYNSSDVNENYQIYHYHYTPPPKKIIGNWEMVGSNHWQTGDFDNWLIINNYDCMLGHSLTGATWGTDSLKVVVPTGWQLTTCLRLDDFDMDDDFLAHNTFEMDVAWKVADWNEWDGTYNAVQVIINSDDLWANIGDIGPWEPAMGDVTIHGSFSYAHLLDGDPNNDEIDPNYSYLEIVLAGYTTGEIGYTGPATYYFDNAVLLGGEQRPCETFILGDINKDCYVGFLDFAILADHWLQCNEPNDPSCTWVP